MINIAICDDEAAVCQAVDETCKQTVSALTYEACSIVSFNSPVELVDAAQKYSFDLILCDIYMPGILGTDAISELRDAGNDSHVIFITSSKDHAVDAFALHADNYLVKPFSRQQLSDAIVPVIERIIQSRSEFINIKTIEGAMVHVFYSRIVSAQTSGHNQIIALLDGDTIETRMSSSELFDKLGADTRFFKAGSSYILNLDNVRSVTGSTVTLANQETIEVPLRLRKHLQERFLERTFDSGI